VQQLFVVPAQAAVTACATVVTHDDAVFFPAGEFSDVLQVVLKPLSDRLECALV